MSETTEFKASDALKSAREAANSDEVARAPRLVELEANAIDKGSLEANVQASVQALRKQREEQGVDPWAKGEIFQRHLSRETASELGTDTAPSCLKRATRDISDQHLSEKYEPLFGPSATPDEVAAWEKSARQQGYAVPRPSEGRAPDKIGLMIGAEVVPGLRDDRPIAPGDEISLRESRQLTRDYRDTMAAVREETLRQLGEEAARVQEPVEQPAPTPQPAPQQPAVDPVAVEKQRLQAWTNYAANVARSSERELLLAAQIRAIDQHAMAHPEMRDQRVFDEVYTKNPERLQQWQE